ncbi:MAG TPA: hypothetical protein VF406_00110 [Thermodesulfobacteriota bacterium]
MATTMDASVACTAAVRALDRRVRAREAREAPAVIALRAAYEGAKAVPALWLWRRWAARCLDHGLRDPRAARLAEAVAADVMANLRAAGADPDWRLAAADAVTATSRFRRALG